MYELNIDALLKLGLTLDAIHYGLFERMLFTYQVHSVWFRQSFEKLKERGHEKSAWLLSCLRDPIDHLTSISPLWFLTTTPEPTGMEFYYAARLSGIYEPYLRRAAELQYLPAVIWNYFSTRHVIDDDDIYAFCKSNDYECAEKHIFFARFADSQCNYEKRMFHSLRASQLGSTYSMNFFASSTIDSNDAVHWFVVYRLLTAYINPWFSGFRTSVNKYLIGKYTCVTDLEKTCWMDSCKKDNTYSSWQNAQQYYLKKKQETQEQVFAWLLCAKQMGLMRDVAFIIAVKIWNTREEEEEE